MTDTLLVIEDEDLLGNELLRHYRSQGWEAVRASTLAEARRMLIDQELDPLVVLSDMNLPDGSALDLLETVRRTAPGGEWILLTGFGSVPDSVRALRLGAYDFLEKPCPTDRLDLVVVGAARSARAQRRLRDETASLHQRYTPSSFVGPSGAAREVREMLGRLAGTAISALVIEGETGTGKGLAARILHASGPRAGGPLVEANCAALPKELLESELFGHEAGAFTGATKRHRGLLEQASGGTIFLDEIGELGLGLQSKLLKAIEDRRVRRVGGESEIPVDVQILAASNRSLANAVRDGSFRDDLYHRLAVFRLWLPPLRDRVDDIEDLVELFIDEFNVKAGRRVTTVPDPVWDRLRAYSWPGNVRELRNVIERGVLLAEDDRFPERWLQLPTEDAGTVGSVEQEDGAIRIPLDGSVSLDEMERHVIVAALGRTRFNVAAAARMLGTTRETLRYRIRKYDITPQD
jgi:two-component system response regulator AtoC